VEQPDSASRGEENLEKKRRRRTKKEKERRGKIIKEQCEQESWKKKNLLVNLFEWDLELLAMTFSYVSFLVSFSSALTLLLDFFF